jgi:acetate kinase
VRERASATFEFLGVRIDSALNQLGGERDISAANAAVRVLVVRTEEDWEIARECRKAL